MADPETLLLTAAAVILLGFAGQLFFRATRISDVLLLIGFGMILGNQIRVFDTQAFPLLAPVIGAFALLIILFEGALDLRFRDLLHGLGRAFLLAVFGFAFTALAVAAVTVYVLDFDWLRGLLLGCILGGSSSIVVMSVIRRLPVHEHTRIILSVESALTDIFCVVGALTVASILALQSTPEVTDVSSTILTQFSMAIFFGLVGGALWLKFLDAKWGHGISYMLTLAAVLLLHVMVESLEASGPVAVLSFGIVLGNSTSLRHILRIKSEGFGKDLRAFQSEVAFVTRAFFFVYLGLILDVGAFDVELLSVGLVLLAAMAVARALAVFLSATGSSTLGPERAVWWAMMPRGLAAAVLASVPSLTFKIPDTEAFVAYAAIVIILTNIVGSFAGLVVPKVFRSALGGKVSPEEPNAAQKARRAS